MKYLRELILKLPAEHFQKVLDQNFTNTEKKLLQFYKESKKAVKDEIISVHLDIKISTLKKLQSKLINDVIEVFSDKEIIHKIDFLKSNNCHRLMLHIAKKKINILKKENNKELIAQIYYTIPYNMLNAMVGNYDIKEMKKFRDQFVIYKTNYSYKEKTILDIVIYLLELSQIKLNNKQAKAYKLKIDKIDTKKDLELLFWKNKLYSEYYSCLGDKTYFDYVKKNYEIVKEHPHLLKDTLVLNSKLQYCFYLQEKNKFQETYNFIKSLIKENPKLLKKGLRYVDLFSQICLALGKYSEARQIILKNYPIENKKPGKFAQEYFGNTTILAMIDMLEDKNDMAFEKITVAKLGLTKKYFIFLDCLLRIVEQAYFLKTKDYDLANSLYLKNMKFYKYHNLDYLKSMENTHRILNYYYKMKFENIGNLNQKHQAFLDEIKNGDFAFVGHFIEQLNPYKK